jgi:D-alanyl-D-alanine carboxypeptidase
VEASNVIRVKWVSRTARVAALAAICLLAVLAPATASAGAFGSALGETQAALDELVAADEGPPGASALIQRGDRIGFLRAGSADLRTGRAFHRTDHMRIASVAKAFSGAVALSLVDRGLLDLDDTLGELLPEATPAAWSEVTLAQLMHHTSGVPSYTDDPAFQEDFRADPAQSFTPQELVDYVADEPPLFEPGSAYHYSNTDNILIGLIAEATTGRVYANDLRQLVYRPLGLRDTSLPRNPVMPRRFIHGYSVEGDEPPADVSEFFNPTGAWASGGIVSTPSDLNAFVRGYGGGELFGRGVRERQFDWVPGCGDPIGPGECSAGLSIYRYRTDCGTVVGHTGNFPGYTQFIATTRNGRNSVVVSANDVLTQEVKPDVFAHLLAADEAAVCALFAGRR